MRVGAFPISIDFRHFSRVADTKEVSEQAWVVRNNLQRRQLILGIDRLDYSKGIPQRLLALDNALERYPDMHGNVHFVQVVVPSRVEVPEYQALKREIEQLVGEINGKYSRDGWTPIHYLFRSLSTQELFGYYRACGIALITPLKDGMNLVCKEYCACSVGEDGVLILSEFAGAAAQLHTGALMVNPYDLEGVADAIYRAFKMEREEQSQRMRRLRRSIQQQNIFRWVNSFLRAAIARDLKDFPHSDFYVPGL